MAILTQRDTLSPAYWFPRHRATIRAGEGKADQYKDAQISHQLSRSEQIPAHSSAGETARSIILYRTALQAYEHGSSRKPVRTAGSADEQ